MLQHSFMNMDSQSSTKNEKEAFFFLGFEGQKRKFETPKTEDQHWNVLEMGPFGLKLGFS